MSENEIASERETDNVRGEGQHRGNRQTHLVRSRLVDDELHRVKLIPRHLDTEVTRQSVARILKGSVNRRTNMDDVKCSISRRTFVSSRVFVLYIVNVMMKARVPRSSHLVIIIIAA